MYNVTMIGNLTDDPVVADREWTVGETGEIVKAKVANFTVGANNGYGKNRTTAYFRVHAWRGLAETCGKCLKKGSQVYVEGPVELNTYIGTDKQPHTSMEVRVDKIVFLDKKTKEDEEPIY